MPAITLNAIKRLVGPTQLVISPQTLYGQMEQMGWLAGTGAEKTTKVVSIGGEKIRILHLLPNVLDPGQDGCSNYDDGDEILGETGL